MYDVREIKPSELPKVFNPTTQKYHKATEQDLQNFGLIRIDNTDYFETVGAFEDGRGQYKYEHELPGKRLAVGRDRLRKIPKHLRGKIMRAKILRHKDPTKSLLDMVSDPKDPKSPAPGVPIRGGSARQQFAVEAIVALDKARQMQDAEELSIAMDDVLPTDVVIEDLLPMHRFAGEP